MRVLYLCHRIPYPPNKGDKIRAYHQLRVLAARHEVDLFTLIDHAADSAHVQTLRNVCRDVRAERIHSRLQRLRALPFLTTNTALTLPYFYSAKLDAAVQQALESRSYDRIVVYCSAMAQYVHGIAWNVPVVTDLVDVDSDKWTQYASHRRFPMAGIFRREARCLRAFEKTICERSAAVLVTTEREGGLVAEICPGANLHVIGNGVDTDYFQPEALSGHDGPPAIVFTGDMSYFPNEDAVVRFARTALPLIHQELPETRFLIVGRNPGRAVKDLAQLPGVEVTGYVSDVRVYLARAQVAVAPFSIACGIQNKILEALSCGLPVVAIPAAAKALVRQVGAAIDTGETPEELAGKTLALLKDSNRARARGAEGRRLVKLNYDWHSSLSRFRELVEDPSSAVCALRDTHTSVR